MSSRRKPIGANIRVALFDSAVVGSVRADADGGCRGRRAGGRWLAAGGWLAAGWRSVAGAAASGRVGSGGGRAGRVLELVDQRFEQEDHQQMRQHVGSGGTRVDTRWAAEADQAFQALERQFDAPAQAIKRENVGGRERLRA